MEETRYPFSPYVSQQRGLPQIQLSMKTPRTGGALHRWSVPITSEIHASISVESKRLPHCFLPIMDASPSVGGFKNPGLSRVRGVAACYQPLLSHMAAQSLDQLLARLFTPTGHRVFPNYFR